MTKERMWHRHFLQGRDNAVCGATNGFQLTRDAAKVTCPKCLPTAKRSLALTTDEQALLDFARRRKAEATLDEIARDIEALG